MKVPSWSMSNKAANKRLHCKAWLFQHETFMSGVVTKQGKENSLTSLKLVPWVHNQMVEILASAEV